MTPDMVVEYLKSYKQCAGRCAHLEIAIREAERRLTTIPDDIKEAMSYHVQQYEDMDMPRGTGVGNPTQEIALRLSEFSMSDELLEAWQEIWRMKVELTQKRMVVCYVDAWLAGLTEKERWLITEQVFEGKYWREITIGWHRKFEEQYGKDHIRKLRALALEKIYQMAA